MTAPEPTASDLREWSSLVGRPAVRVEPLEGDVSLRRYARVELENGESVIVAYYPESIRESAERYLETGALLAGAGVRVARILEADLDRGLMMLEDLGRETLYDLRSTPFADRMDHFEEAVEISSRIAALPADRVSEINPDLDGEVLSRELDQTVRLFLTPRELIVPGLASTLSTLCEELAGEELRPCHRDLMARNLIPTPGGELSVIDHQDLRLGPPAYDLASLLNDSFFPPASLEETLLSRHFGDSARPAGYHRAAAQRTLKAIGTYVSFAERGADRYLGLIPLSLSRCLIHLGRLPEAAEIIDDLKRSWAPVIAGAPA